MISEKMFELGNKSSVIRGIFEYGNKRKQEIGADKVFDFSLGNPSVSTHPEVTRVMKDLLENSDPVEIHGYTSSAGDYSVRSKIAENINFRFNANATADLIYITCGAAAALTITLNAVLKPQEEVIVLAPFFPEYTVFIEKAGGTPVIVPCSEPDFQIDFEKLQKAINKNTKAIIINSPNNPTGVVLSEKTIKKLANLLNEKAVEFGNEFFIIADEPYRELAYNGVKVPYIPSYYNNTIVCYSYSKSLSLPGERIGYVFVSPKVKDAVRVFKAVSGAGRALGYVCAPSLLQKTIAECLNLTSDISVYEKNRETLYKYLTTLGFEVAKPDGAFYLFMKALEPDAAAFCERAKKWELLLVPSNDFGVSGYVRISYCVSEQTVNNSLLSFKQLFDSYKGETK